jgi:hypothetical protein
MICLQHPSATRDEVRGIPLGTAGWLERHAQARPITRLKPNLTQALPVPNYLSRFLAPGGVAAPSALREMQGLSGSAVSLLFISRLAAAVNSSLCTPYCIMALVINSNIHDG